MAISYVKHHVGLNFVEPVLGTVPMNPEIYKDYIESKKPENEQEEEFGSVEKKEGRGWTGFHREPDLYERPDGSSTTDPLLAKLGADLAPIVRKRGHLFTYDYTVRGFLKESSNALRQIAAHDVKGCRGKIDQFVFAYPRRIPFLAEKTHAADRKAGGCGCGPEGATGCFLIHAPHDVLERPLRADTPLGPRVALARSDLLNAGTRLEFDLKILWPKVFTEEILRMCFERGEMLGFGQFRTGSYGRFTYTLDCVEVEAGKSAKMEIEPPTPRGKAKKAPSAAPKASEPVPTA
jgi:hypothetical protein